MISFLRKYVRKFYFAFAGLFHGVCHDHSIMLQVFIGCAVIVACAFLSLNGMEWALILIVIASVIALEFVNSAIEEVVDMVCPHYHESAKKIKDYAAAAVLMMSIVAAIVGVIIIGGKLW
ncbi:diacylglycerol kinase family protein [Amedibacillus sp. YH-ame6]